MLDFLKKNYIKILKRFIIVCLLVDFLHWNAKIKTILALESLLCLFFFVWILKIIIENNDYLYYWKLNIKLKYIQLLKKKTYNYKFYNYKKKEKNIIILYILILIEKKKYILKKLKYKYNLNKKLYYKIKYNELYI